MKNNTRPLYSLITGASKGLGKAFAMELAGRGRNLILVSLPGENLEKLASQIKSNGTDAVYYETDLTTKTNILSLSKWVNENYEVDLLINNAGIGGHSKFVNTDVDFIDNMIQLNVMATSLMTHQLLPNLLRQKKAHVLNISSLAALSPMGYKTVYPASKAFIHSFTLGMQQEYSETNVFFSVVNPGPMRTNGKVQENIAQTGFWANAIELGPEKVAALSLQKMFGGEKVIKLDWTHRMSLMLLKLPTGLKMAILGRVFRKNAQ